MQKLIRALVVLILLPVALVAAVVLYTVAVEPFLEGVKSGYEDAKQQ